MIGSLFVMLCALAQPQEPTPNAPDGLSQRMIQAAYEKYNPTICLLSYTTEITSRTSGEVSKRGSHALALIVSSDGLVMAHGHMFVENRKPFNIKVEVGTDDERQEYDAILLNKPDDINVTFLRIESEEPTEFPFIPFEQNPELGLGAPLAVIGILGQSLDYARIVEPHRIGAVLKEPRTTYCLDRSIPFGYVGGPVIDAKGRAIAVVGFDLSSNEGGDLYTRSGHPLVYQAELFQNYIDNPPSEEGLDSDREDAWLGVFTQPLVDDLAEYWGLDKNGGIVISTVIAGSPAERTGLRSGDIIVNFDGTPITIKQDEDVLNFTKLIRETPIGEVVALTLLRDGKPVEIRLALTIRPKSARDANEYEDTVFGLTVRELTRDVRITLNVSEETNGVIVRAVRAGSPANLARIRPGFIILAFGDYPVAGLEEFEAAVDALVKSKPAEITVFCRVGAATAFFRIQPRWGKED